MNPLRAIKKLLFGPAFGWKGDYKNWEEARSASSGYEEENILEKVRTALLKVKRGEAVAERDSVLFDEVQYSWPLLAELMHIAAQNQGRLNVLDFGGSLGSTYFQNKKYLDSLSDLKWSIVEQENFVATGKLDFEDEILRFYPTVDECIRQRGRPDLILLSCVLPYLPEPYQMLDQLKSHGVPYILIENTPLQEIRKEDILCVQKVHPSIYKASYPCWLLNRQKVIGHLSDTYTLNQEYENESVIGWKGNKIRYQGMLFNLADL